MLGDVFVRDSLSLSLIRLPMITRKSEVSGKRTKTFALNDYLGQRIVQLHNGSSMSRWIRLSSFFLANGYVLFLSSYFRSLLY